jgi:N-alpha-acetyl-L-2,4-diaminobutyrate deacetylase
MSDTESPIRTEIDLELDGKQVAYLRAPHSRNRSAWGSLLIPITVIKNGTGPTILFTGGVHGDEYEGPVCLMKLSREVQAKEIQGRIIIIPALNLPATLVGQRLSPIDGKDLNRVFPGNPRGTMTDLIADYVQRELLPLCDVVVDLHSGGYSLRFVPYISMHYLEDQVQTKKTFAALKAFDAPVGLLIQEISGEGLLDYEVERMGNVFLCAELGGGGMLAVHTLEVAEVGVRNILKHFDVIPGEIVPRQARGLPPTRLMEVPGPENYHTAMADGVYEPFFELGDTVEAGDLLGQVHFLEDCSRPPQPILAQRSGLLIGVRSPANVERGDCVAVVARDLAGSVGPLS